MSKGIRLSDIDPKYREQIEAATSGTKKRTTRKAAPAEKGVRWRCHACGELFSTQASVDRHDPEHHRIEWIIP